MTTQIALRDRLMADALSAGSAVAELFPWLGTAVGHQNKPPQLAARWRHANLASQTVDSWQSFEGSHLSSRMPRGYPRVALIAIEKTVLDEFQASLGGQQAVAYALGSTVMVGTVEKQTRFLGDYPDDPSRYAVGMRIGQGPLHAAIALRTGTGDVVVPPVGMSSGQAYELAEWPSSVPLV